MKDILKLSTTIALTVLVTILWVFLIDNKIDLLYPIIGSVIQVLWVLMLFKEIKVLISKIISNMFQPLPKPKCKICKDTKEIEVIVMGNDTDYVKCPYCDNGKRF